MAKQTWVPVFGKVRIQDGTITLVPEVAPPPAHNMPAADNAPAQPPHAIVRSSAEFEQGTITWEAKLGEPKAIAQLMLPAEVGPTSPSDSLKADAPGPELSVGLNVLGAPFGFALFRNAVWEGVAGSGHGTPPPVRQWIHMRVTVRGSIADLYVEGVKVASANRMLKRGQIGVLLQSVQECSIRNVSIVGDAPTCFAVMQFTEEFDTLYRDVIKPVCQEYGYEVIRGDDFYTSGQIMDDVTQSIRSAALIIADVTPDNANVFYEVGFAHAIGKPTILLSDRKRERLPFDISGFRTLFYDNTIGGKSVVEARLRQHLDALRSK